MKGNNNSLNSWDSWKFSGRKFIKYDFFNSENFIDNTHENFHLEF